METKIIILILIFGIYHSKAQNITPPFINLQNQWIDSVFHSMSLDERIAQLCMIRVGKSDVQFDNTLDLIKKYHPGGVTFFKNEVYKTAQRVNDLQNVSKIPLLTSIDAEWGLSMRLETTMHFPVAMALGALQNDSLIADIAYSIGKQCKAIGINLNFAPVSDVNSNPQNPIINFRSFGENPYKVAHKANIFMQAMQKANILSCSKHFPGHGDTKTDSHLDLPIVNKSYNQIQKMELIPFQKLVNNGVSSVMTAHIHWPQLDKQKNLSGTLSPKVLSILTDSLHFKGLLITDGLEMKGIAQYYTPEQIAVMALQAGADILLLPKLAPSIEGIKKAIKEGKLTEERINQSCRKILQAKYWLGLNKIQKIDLSTLDQKLFSKKAKVAQQKVFRQILTVIKNTNNLLPVKDLSTTKYATLSIGSDTITTFQLFLDKYQIHTNYFLHKNATKEEISTVISELKKANNIIVSLHGLRLSARNKYGLTSSEIDIIQQLTALNKNTIFNLFGNPYTLQYIKDWKKFDAVTIAYQDNKFTESFMAQLIYGAQDATGKLPVSIDKDYPAGTGINIKSIGRLKYGIPEDVHLNSHKLNHKIDSIALMAIDSGAFPGCQVLVAKDGEVVFHKSYGFHTYDKKTKVKNNDIYDLASVTKVTAGVPAIMYMISQGKLSLNDKIADYYPLWQHSNKKDIRFIDALTHQARLEPWIPFYKTAKHIGFFRRPVFKAQQSNTYSIKVAPNLYEHKRYPKIIYKKIAKSPLLEKKEYKYSGLSFYIYPKIIENMSGQNWQDFLQNTFYKPLGADNTGFLPYKKFPLDRIIPTEKDSFFRMPQLQGYVHDEGAAMMNGMSSNAGLFSTANDLAKITQMYCQMGTYAGKRYIADSVFRQFIKRPFAHTETKNRRGIGFDKSYIDNSTRQLANAYPAPSCSESSFGHGGYTGTFIWVDPETKITFIFLSNRVYPTRKNSKLYKLNIRPAMHQAIYDAIEKE